MTEPETISTLRGLLLLSLAFPLWYYVGPARNRVIDLERLPHRFLVLFPFVFALFAVLFGIEIWFLGIDLTWRWLVFALTFYLLIVIVPIEKARIPLIAAVIGMGLSEVSNAVSQLVQSVANGELFLVSSVLLGLRVTCAITVISYLLWFFPVGLRRICRQSVGAASPQLGSPPSDSGSTGVRG